MAAIRLVFYVCFALAVFLVHRSTALFASSGSFPGVNFTCPINCTCSSDRPGSPGRVSSHGHNSLHSSIPQFPNLNLQNTLKVFPILSSRTTVECDEVSANNLRDTLSSLPEGITSFALRHAELTSLSDICCMEDLENLDLSHNRISDLIVYIEFEKLVSLNLRNNELRILRKDEFISFPNIEILMIDYNEIEVIDQESFRLMRLRRLYLSHNKLTYISERTFRYASNMKLLDLSANSLASIHARNFYFSRQLQSLDLSYNQLTHVDEYGFDPLYRLQELNLSFNNFTLLPSAALRKLTSLRLLIFDGNPISILGNSSISQLPSLESIRMDHMTEMIMILDGAFNELPRLRSVSVSNCKNFQYLSPNAFLHIDTLEQLNLTNNGLSFLPSAAFGSSLTKIDFSNNPIDCSCLRHSVPLIPENQRPMVADQLRTICDPNTAIDSPCIPAIVPSQNTQLIRSVGVSISMYCAVISDQPDSYTPLWTLPNGQMVLPGQQINRFFADQERLTIDYSLADDGGVYRCSIGLISNGSAIDVNSSVHYVNLRIDPLTSVIIPVEVSAYHVTWTWSHSRADRNTDNTPSLNYRPAGECRLIFKSDQEEEFIYIDLPLLWERYTVTRLRPGTNYSFCLVLSRDEVALYKYCTHIQTEKVTTSPGVSLNYVLIALLAVSATLICALCLVRCVHKRLHIWQEEKYRGRMQASLSAQGFLSSFESLTNGSLASVAANSVTYENRAAFENEEAETVLSDMIKPETSTSSRLSSRKNGSSARKLSHKYALTGAQPYDAA